jgi:hypothetical protein
MGRHSLDRLLIEAVGLAVAIAVQSGVSGFTAAFNIMIRSSGNLVSCFMARVN